MPPALTAGQRLPGSASAAVFRFTIIPLTIMNISLKTPLSFPLLWLSAFGASAVVGAAAAVLWAPASGLESRNRLATGLNGWWQAMRSPANPWQNRLSGAGTKWPDASGEPNLAMQPNRLLTAD